MNRDTFILIAFVAFVFLVGIRIRQRWAENKSSRKEDMNRMPEEGKEEIPDKGEDRKILRKRLRRLFTLLQLLVLGGLIVYMAVALVDDFNLPERGETKNLILRCLIFVFTIYIFISRGRDLLRQRVKGNKKK